MRIIGCLLLFASITVAGQENWLIDRNGCKIYNPFPRKHEAVEWTGDCLNGVANGYGQLIWFLKGKNTNNVYTGIMFNGRPEGEGKYVTDTKVAKTIYEGEFHNGELPFGKIITYFKKDTIEYFGEIKNWKANGLGVMHFSDGAWFKGELKDDYFFKGVFTLEKLGFAIESANWKRYTPITGKIIWSDGTIYEGEIKKLKPHGEGMVTYPDGINEFGIWKNGEIVRKNGM